MAFSLVSSKCVSWALLLVAVSPCLADEPSPRQPSGLAAAVNEVGFELLYAQQAETHDENLVFSPLSILSGVSMLEAGAGGQTAAELRAATRFAGASPELAAAWSRLLSELEPEEEDFTLRYAAQLWGAREYDYQPGWLQTLRENYRAELFLLDFRNEPERARAEIDKWLRQQTGGRIELSGAPPITPDTTLLMTSALYFRGYWAHPFQTQLTEEATFATKVGENETPPKVPLMRQIARLRYSETSHCQFVELPYRGERIALNIVLPKQPDLLRSDERWLSAAGLHELRSSARQTNVEILLPRFQTMGDGSLKQTLHRLGVRTAFGPEADFTAMAGKSNLYLQDIRHQALIDLNESGTEVAAVTTAFIAKSALEAEVVVRADRPFLFFVTDRRTHTILLMGKFAGP